MVSQGGRRHHRSEVSVAVVVVLMSASHLLYCTVLCYCPVLCCAVMCCTVRDVLCSTVLHSTVAVLHSASQCSEAKHNRRRRRPGRRFAVVS
jgi:hypothetical protein